MKSNFLGKIGLASVLSGVVVIGLLAGCGGSTTITATKTVTSGGGAGSTVTATTTVTSGGGGTGSVMGDLVIYGDMVTSGGGCLAISVAHRGEVVVFRNRVVDPKTGKDMTDKDLKTGSVQAILPDGTKFTLAYGGHPGGGTPTDYFWSYGWEVPLTYPTGSLGYTVTATANDGRTGSFKPFEVASSKLTIGQYDATLVAGKSISINAGGVWSAATLTCSQGAKVTFTNKDAIPHAVVLSDKTLNLPATGTTPAAGTNTYVFTTAGTFTVHLDTATGAPLTITVNAAS